MRNHFFCDRLEWEDCVQKLYGDMHFSRLYRMDYKTFAKLYGIVDPFLKVDKDVSMIRTGGMDPTITTGTILPWSYIKSSSI